VREQASIELWIISWEWVMTATETVAGKWKGEIDLEDDWRTIGTDHDNGLDTVMNYDDS
jgi:hypothetical protein